MSDDMASAKAAQTPSNAAQTKDEAAHSPTANAQVTADNARASKTNTYRYALSMFSKPPVPGLVKTRLTRANGGLFSEEEAAQLIF